VQVFKVLLDSPATNHPAVAAAKAKRSLRWPLVAGGLALLVIVAGVALWQRPWAPREEPASEANMAFPLPDKPSIAVLPFNNLSDDASQEYFADGMTEDLITDLSKLSGLFVIARNSVFTYKGKAVKVRQVAEELGVRYVLEGSVRRVGDQVRINTQLVDATTGGHLWAERYDGSLADVFALQDRVTANIIKALAVTLTPEERQDVASFGTKNIAAHDAFLQGQSFYLRDTPEDNAKAEAYFKRAVELDPEFARASAALAKVYLKAYWKDWEDALQLYWRDGYRLVFQQLERVAGKRIPGVHIVRARLAIRKRQLDVAVMEAKRALELSPNDVEALETLSEALIFTGTPDEGRKLAEQAMRLNPTLPARALYLVGLSHLAEGNFQEAAAHIERALRHAPTVSEYAGALAAAYGKLGLEEKAVGAYETYRKAWQDINPSVELAMVEFPFSDARILESLADGFEKAGAGAGDGHGHSHDVGPSRYLQLHSGAKLDGKEIKSLLFGRTIKGITYPYNLKRPWSQVRTEGGKVTHTGFPIIVYGANQKHGTSWIEDDRLCDRWPEVSEDFSLCALIYRNPGGTRARRNEYIMVTDYGPQPFSPTD
jgi:TolB-like protein/Flp pilus assembly protein TadD